MLLPSLKLASFVLSTTQQLNPGGIRHHFFLSFANCSRSHTFHRPVSWYTTTRHFPHAGFVSSRQCVPEYRHLYPKGWHPVSIKHQCQSEHNETRSGRTGCILLCQLVKTTRPKIIRLPVFFEEESWPSLAAVNGHRGILRQHPSALN